MSRVNSIMLVEDDQITNFINERLIKKLNITQEIKVSLNGKEALSKISECLKTNHLCPELIFLDINMPVMDGFEFLQNFQQLRFDHKERIVIVMLTTSSNEHDLDKLVNLGHKDFLNKPLTEDKVKNILDKYFPNNVLSKTA
ncbi:MAG TPA: response regulator [Cytophagaceae bacterium]|jgi:CheY-like chemotaxis protein